MENDTLLSEGICSFCSEKLSSRALARHLKKHLSEKATQLPGGGKKAFHLLVTGEGWFVAGKVYFLHLLVDGEASIFELDDFLRAIWLECCGHLSSFHIKGRKYEYDWMDDEAIIGEDVEQPVGNVFQTGQVLLYEYDFGSTTRLEIKVLGEYPLDSKDNIVLMSRNEALHIICDNCGKKPAAQLCSIHYGDEPQFFCTACGKKHAKTFPDFEDYSAFPVVNSPRMGVCGYMGSESIDTERDKAWNGK
ncbi:MAG: hypothetical protein H6574_25830 [Lewinellaceae bacterium]|nr:hypothetical protein [Lewinellaceae bacterium]